MSEKIAQFESKIEEIVGLYEQLKDENLKLQYAVCELTGLEVKFAESEECRNQLKSENKDLRLSIADLKAEVAQLNSIVLREQAEPKNDNLVQLKSEITVLSEEIDRLKSYKRSADNHIDADQELLNCNIVIRGAEVSADTSESELVNLYNGLKNHLGVADVAEFEPVSIKIINTNSLKNNTSSKPFRLQFGSVATKR